MTDTTTRPEEVTKMVTHIDTCTTGPDDTEFVEGRTEYHVGPDRCPACDEDWAIVNEGERRAEFGSGWVASGGDPADVGAAWSQEKAMVAERDEAERNQRIENEVADEAHRRAGTRPKDRPVKGWRLQHVDCTDQPFRGKWEFEPGCGCAKCENHMTYIQDCLGEWEIV